MKNRAKVTYFGVKETPIAVEYFKTRVAAEKAITNFMNITVIYNYRVVFDVLTTNSVYVNRQNITTVVISDEK